jgi:hypothetical protein
LQLLQNFAVYLIYHLTLTNKHMKNSNTVTRNNENAKANIIAFGVMAVVIILGLVYGMQLEAIGY